MISNPIHRLSTATTFAAALTCSLAAQAHVVLPAGGAAAGSTYRANFIVGHACKDATVTTALSVKLPAGFEVVTVEPREGWTLDKSADQLTWKAASPAAALPGSAPASFTVVGKLPAKPTTLWFPARQTCDVGSADWAVVSGAADPKPAYPAPHLDVLPPGTAAVDARGARAQPTFGPQRTTTVFVRLTAPSGARLVGASSPDGHAAVHEMKMEGNVMKMRELPEGIDLPPGQPVALTPSTLHIMVTELDRPLPAGSELPLTLHFVDREGRHGDLALRVPVSVATGGSAAMEEHHHEH